MQLRRQPGVAGFVAAVFSALGLAACAPEPEVAAENESDAKPNIVVFYVDDLGYGGTQKQLSILMGTLNGPVTPHVYCLSQIADPHVKTIERLGVGVTVMPRSRGFEAKRLVRLAAGLARAYFNTGVLKVQDRSKPAAERFEALFGLHGDLGVWVDRKGGFPVVIEGEAPFGPFSVAVKASLVSRRGAGQVVHLWGRILLRLIGVRAAVEGLDLFTGIKAGQGDLGGNPVFQGLQVQGLDDPGHLVEQGPVQRTGHDAVVALEHREDGQQGPLASSRPGRVRWTESSPAGGRRRQAGTSG